MRHPRYCTGTAWPGVKWLVNVIHYSYAWFLPFPYSLNPVCQKIYIESPYRYISYLSISICFHCRHPTRNFHAFSLALLTGVSPSSWLTPISFPYNNRMIFFLSVSEWSNKNVSDHRTFRTVQWLPIKPFPDLQPVFWPLPPFKCLFVLCCFSGLPLNLPVYPLFCGHVGFPSVIWVAWSFHTLRPLCVTLPLFSCMFLPFLSSHPSHLCGYWFLKEPFLTTPT